MKTEKSKSNSTGIGTYSGTSVRLGGGRARPGSRKGNGGSFGGAGAEIFTNFPTTGGKAAKARPKVR